MGWNREKWGKNERQGAVGLGLAGTDGKGGGEATEATVGEEVCAGRKEENLWGRE
jgi:hypothetical protein